MPHKDPAAREAYRSFDYAAPLPCQGCWALAATTAVYHGLVWQVSLCVACAEAHRAVHGEQLDLFGREEEDRG